jgi:Na+/proline symporter
MNRSADILTKLALAMAIGECVSAVAIAVEDYKGSVPAFAVVFAALFFGGFWLLRTRRVVAGACVVGLLSVFEIVSFPGWQKHNSYDWAFDVVYAIVGTVTLVFAVRTLIDQRRQPLGV